MSIFRRGRRIEAKTSEQLLAMRQAGRVVGDTLTLASERAVAGITTRELDALAGEPAFLARCRAAHWLHVDHIGIRAVPALRAAGVTTPSLAPATTTVGVPMHDAASRIVMASSPN